MRAIIGMRMAPLQAAFYDNLLQQFRAQSLVTQIYFFKLYMKAFFPAYILVCK
jgi:hypothetical protein